MIKPQGRQRISKEDMYLNSAENFAYRSTCLKRKYGAVIVKDDAVISTGYNGSPRGYENCCDIGVCPRMQRNMHQSQISFWKNRKSKRADTGSRPVSYQYQPGG